MKPLGLVAWQVGDPAAGGSGRAIVGRPGSRARSDVPRCAAALEHAVRVAPSPSLRASGRLCSAAPRSSLRCSCWGCSAVSAHRSSLLVLQRLLKTKSRVCGYKPDKNLTP